MDGENTISRDIREKEHKSQKDRNSQKNDQNHQRNKNNKDSNKKHKTQRTQVQRKNKPVHKNLENPNHGPSKRRQMQQDKTENEKESKQTVTFSKKRNHSGIRKDLQQKEKNSPEKDKAKMKIKHIHGMQNVRKETRQETSAKQTTCNADEQCLDLAVKYMKQVKDTVKNYNAQKSRIEKLSTLPSSKAGKKGDFTSDLTNLKDAGGGNLSALTCQGNTTGPGQAALKDAVDKLTACPNSIKSACETGLPSYNKTVTDNCAKAMTTLSVAVTACTLITDATKVCACWKAANIKSASDAITNCSLKDTNTNFITFKNACTASFADCRKTQDSASSVLYACNAGNSPANLIGLKRLLRG